MENIGFMVVLASLMGECRGKSKVEIPKDDPTTAGTEERRNGIGSHTLAIIIGSIVGSFVIILVLQWLLKKYFCYRKRGHAGSDVTNSRSQPSTFHDNGSTQFSLPEASPPSYTDIHLFRQLNATTCTAVYFSIPGMKSYYGALSKWPTTSYENEIDCDPPSYNEAEDEENNSCDESTSTQFDENSSRDQAEDDCVRV